MRAPPRRILLAAQIVAAAIAFYFIGRELLRQWSTFRAVPLETHLTLGPILFSAILVIGTYAVLVQTWRVLLAEEGQNLGFMKAASIWSVSNLWRYVPGKLWQIGVMSGLARRESVSASAAAGSAVLSTLINIAAGLALVLLLGWRWLGLIDPGARAIAIALVVSAVIGLLALPFVLPRFAVVVQQLTGRDVRIGAPKPRALVVATIGNLVAWIVYGIAFMWLVRGVLGDAAGATWQYVAVFTASYVVGYLFLFVPGGIGPREAVMALLLTSLTLTSSSKQAWYVAGASRIWLTVLEIVPGVLFLAFDVAARRSTARPPSPPAPGERNASD